MSLLHKLWIYDGAIIFTNLFPWVVPTPCHTVFHNLTKRGAATPPELCIIVLHPHIPICLLPVFVVWVRGFVVHILLIFWSSFSPRSVS